MTVQSYLSSVRIPRVDIELDCECLTGVPEANYSAAALAESGPSGKRTGPVARSTHRHGLTASSTKVHFGSCWRVRKCRLGRCRIWPSVRASSDGDDGAPPSSRNSPPPLTLAAVLALPAIVIGTYVAQNGGPAEFLQEVVNGDRGPAFFVGSYVVATVALLPASVLTLAAGYLYGPIKGTALVSIASTTAAATAFLISRYLVMPEPI
ncbi:hypothetical protein CYMTET_23000 [Cymbomonas tetramitiformis]|uniref:Uncharacterized protein n=1 Tax=Cymbomonas tetramitiformis TaxID=36881 RepID=A0AAE0L1D6_9CHLO|nr:hypothetical protein CYMTET_23000 [Cymbomonas tetramitiformis]